MRYTIFFEYDEGGTDWAALYADNSRDARQKFNETYTGCRILKIEEDKGQPEGWN